MFCGRTIFSVWSTEKKRKQYLQPRGKKFNQSVCGLSLWMNTFAEKTGSQDLREREILLVFYAQSSSNGGERERERKKERGRKRERETERVCVCVCESDSEREQERERGRKGGAGQILLELNVRRSKCPEHQQAWAKHLSVSPETHYASSTNSIYPNFSFRIIWTEPEQSGEATKQRIPVQANSVLLNKS